MMTGFRTTASDRHCPCCGGTVHYRYSGGVKCNWCKHICDDGKQGPPHNKQEYLVHPFRYQENHGR